LQWDIPQFETANTQVLGVSVDGVAASKAWATQLGLTYPLLSDVQCVTARTYGVLYDDPKMADDPQEVRRYLSCKRAWFVTDKQGVICYVEVVASGSPEHLPNADFLKLLNELK
jgi:peroxiredoxin